MQQLMLNDPEMKRLRFEENRLAQLVNARIRNPERSTERLEGDARRYAEEKELQLAAATMNPTAPAVRAAPGWDGQQIVREFCTGQFHVDAPLTRRQVEQLESVMLAAKISEEGRIRDARFDWDRIEPEAERILTPRQMENFRKLAALARANVLMAAAEKDAAVAQTP